MLAKPDTTLPSLGGPVVTPRKTDLTTATEREYPRGKIFSGGLLSDIGDIFGIPFVYAPFGFLSGATEKGKELLPQAREGRITGPEIFGKAVVSGLKAIPQAVEKRYSGADYLKQIGFPEGPKIAGIPTREIAGFAAEMAIAPPIEKGLGLGTKLLAAPLRKLGPRIEPIVKTALIGEKLSPAELKRVEQIRRGGLSLGAKEEKIREFAKPLAQLVKEKVPFLKKVGEKLPSKYLARKATTEAERMMGAELGKKTGELLTKDLSRAEQLRVGQILRGGLSIGKKEEKLRMIAGIARRNMDDVSRELVEELRTGGIPTAETKIQTILQNIGSYFPRMYRKFLENPDDLADFLVNTKRQRMMLNHLRKRKDIPEAVRKAMGEILEPGFPFAQTITEVKSDIALSKFFRFVNKHFADVVNRTGDLVQLPDTAKLGVLRKKWVPAPIAKDLKGVLRIPAPGITGKLGRLHNKLLNMWKVGKVVLNPATHGRNMLSNAVLMDLGGYPTWTDEGIKYFAQALRELQKRGKIYKKARSLGLVGGTYYGAELKDFLDAFEKVDKGNLISRVVKAVTSKAGDLYRAEEEASKLAMVLWRLDQGDDLMKAVKYAHHWLFDYRDIPELIRFLRNVPFGYPFITFPYKAIPRFVEAGVKAPTKILKYYRAFNAVEGENRAKEEAALPEYIRRGLYIRLPWTQKVRTATGEEIESPLYLDLNYILPWGDIGELGARGIRKLLPQDPIANITIVLGSRRDPWTGREVWKETDTNEEKTIKFANWLYRTLLPSLAPEIPLLGIKGGYSWDKIFSAIAKRPTEYRGILRDIPTTIFDVGFGLKAQPIQLKESMRRRAFERRKRIDEIRANIRSIGRMKGLTPKEKAKRLRKEREKLKKEIQKQKEELKGFGPTIK